MKKLQALLKETQKLDIRVQELVEGLLQGAHLSRFRGRGIEFSDVREYQWGDDVRTIDWNITARMGTPYIKEFVEERDVDICLLLDVSGSTNFGDAVSKQQRAHIIAASFALAALNKNDSIGAVLFTDHIVKYIPARKGKRHAMAMLETIISHVPKNKATDVAKVVEQARFLFKPKSIVIVISDFPSTQVESAFRKLRIRHIPLALHLMDQRELELPDVGYLRLEDEETQEQILVDTSDPEFRERFHSLAMRRIETLRQNFNRCNVPYFIMDQNITSNLQKFFGGRT